MANNITSASAVLVIIVPELAIVHQVQGFSADSAFDVDAQDIAENVMGVDGKKSSGWIPQMYTQAVHLQADSDSIAVFDQIYQFSNINRTFYEITATLTYPATNKSYSFINGTLTNYKPLPDAKKTLDPQDFTIVWESVIPAVIG
jgi:hypothetical protein